MGAALAASLLLMRTTIPAARGHSCTPTVRGWHFCLIAPSQHALTTTCVPCLMHAKVTPSD